MTPISKKQLKLDFEPSLLQQFRTLKQCVSATVYNFRGGLTAVAAACDKSPSTLTKELNPQEHEENRRNLDIDYLETIIRETGDIRPILWLVARFIPDDATRREAALSCIEQILPALTQALAEIKKGK